MKKSGNTGLGTWQKDNGQEDGKLGWVQVVKVCVGPATGNLDSVISYLGTVLLLQTTVQGEDIGPRVAYRDTCSWLTILQS